MPASTPQHIHSLTDRRYSRGPGRSRSGARSVSCGLSRKIRTAHSKKRRVITAQGHLVLRPRDYVTKLVSGPLTCKLPLDVNPVAIHATVPAPSLLAQASDVSDSAFA